MLRCQSHPKSNWWNFSILPKTLLQIKWQLLLHSKDAIWLHCIWWHRFEVVGKCFDIPIGNRTKATQKTIWPTSMARSKNQEANKASKKQKNWQELRKAMWWYTTSVCSSLCIGFVRCRVQALLFCRLLHGR